MKRVGQLLDAIAEPENLRLACWKASKGKRTRPDCRAFASNLDEELLRLRQELLSGEPRIGDYRYFKVYDPKERTICAASFRERVMHHALMNLCEPVLDRAAIHDSYACRKGKGRQAAVTRAQAFARRFPWFVKLDVRKYFDSIDHATLRGLLLRKFKDSALLGIFDRIIGSYETGRGRGLPIGNLTSQHFANHYLGPLDRFVKEELAKRGYVRYMDDFVIWGESREEMRGVRRAVETFLGFHLRLSARTPASGRTTMGLPFLGYRVYPQGVGLARRSRIRFSRKLRRFEREWALGRMTGRELQRRMDAMLAFVQDANSRAFRLRMIERFGVAANGLEPGDSGWQLEQQREEQPDGEPQQQLA